MPQVRPNSIIPRPIRERLEAAPKTNGVHHESPPSPEEGNRIQGLAAGISQIMADCADDIPLDPDLNPIRGEFGPSVKQVKRVGKEKKGRCEYEGIVAETAQFIQRYIVIQDDIYYHIIAGWIVAAWLIDAWDCFPHLAICSPEKRCGKSSLLDLLQMIAPRAELSTNISPAAMYRTIQSLRPTLILDEAQSLARLGSEASEVNRELLNSSIRKGQCVLRCGGKRGEQVHKFSIYCPKVFAMIGAPDPILADRCLVVNLRRKTDDENVERFRIRKVKREAQVIHDKIKAWADANKEQAERVYADELTDRFEIANDRLADLLEPLQAVMLVADQDGLPLLQDYADVLDSDDSDQEKMSVQVRLLAAIQQIFYREKIRTGHRQGPLFLATHDLIERLVARKEEPWGEFNKGYPISREKLSHLLRPYGIKPAANRENTARGYTAVDFKEAWRRYLGSFTQ